MDLTMRTTLKLIEAKKAAQVRVRVEEGEKLTEKQEVARRYKELVLRYERQSLLDSVSEGFHTPSHTPA